MQLESSSDPATRPTRDQLLAQFGEEYLSIQSLFHFSFVPGGRLNLLRELAAPEDWGANHHVLLKYLAVHVRLALEQERYAWNGDQMVLCAGRLATALGSPIYVGLVPNSAPQENPWVLNWVGERPSCAVLPEPPELGAWPDPRNASEVVMACDLTHEEHKTRVPWLAGAPLVAQVCALTGAAHWALQRGLAVRHIHAGGRGFFVPLWLESREDLESVPDAVAPLQVQCGRMVARTLLVPAAAYSAARAVVERAEQLPAWLLEAWDQDARGEPQAAAGEA